MDLMNDRSGPLTTSTSGTSSLSASVHRVAATNALLLVAACLVTVLVLSPRKLSSFAADEAGVLVGALALVALVNLHQVRRVVGPLQQLTELAREVDGRRRRRGVRGGEYAWANAVRLHRALASVQIEYRHHRELAPTTELRHNYAEDDRRGVGKRSRVELAPVYRERYTREILDRVDLSVIVAELPVDGAGALFCVEADPEACHRSMIAERLSSEYAIAVKRQRPQRA